ncbi:hypothetical protein FRC18_005889 [Serendipita sp. 400]|nr:hypothetical protein FRC18_005889 [Serendipita sp. 400]
MNRRDTAAMKNTVKAPRDQLERCVFILRLSADLRNRQDKNNDKEVCKFVDEAYEFLREAASGQPSDTSSKQLGTKDSTTSKSNWDHMKEAIDEIKHLVPDKDIATQAEQVEIEDQNASSKLVNISTAIKAKTTQGFGTRDIELFILGEVPNGTVIQTLNVKKRTPPYALAMALIFQRGQEMVGSSLDFYHPNSISAVTRPSQWNECDQTPKRLYVVPSRGYYTFESIPSVTSSFGTDHSIFRNIFKLIDDGNTYFKESSGVLWRKPKGSVIDEKEVSCSLVNQPNSRKQFITWDEVVEEIGVEPDDSWEVKPASEDAKDIPTEGSDAGSTSKVNAKRTKDETRGNAEEIESGNWKRYPHQESSQRQDASSRRGLSPGLPPPAEEAYTNPGVPCPLVKPKKAKKSFLQRAVEWLKGVGGD